MTFQKNQRFFRWLTVASLLLSFQTLASNYQRTKPAVGAKLLVSCTDVLAFQLDNTTITQSSEIASGEETVGGEDIAAHCRVSGNMFERVSEVDGETYAIGFEIRLPLEWNGRFFYQANGGLDGRIAPAFGAVSGGGPLTNALHKGFAVISSDAGHSGAQNATFGIDPQARLDYGYEAVQKLTPMAKTLIKLSYGKLPDYSYIGGTSNGGRHTMVAASRIPEEYDGYLAHNPGFHLPNTALHQVFSAQQLANVASDSSDLSTAFTQQERQLVADNILRKCDSLDGLADGMVFNLEACSRAFNLFDDVPTCSDDRDGSCLSQQQKIAIDAIHAGAKNSLGEPLYAPFAYDPGIVGSSWATWKFSASISNRDPLALAFVFTTPPQTDLALNTDPNLQRAFTLGFDMDTDAEKIKTTTPLYNTSAVDFMYPLDENRMAGLKESGGKMMVIMGTADPVYSTVDTENWYNNLNRNHRGCAKRFVRYFRVPGMNHSRNGVTTDQYDAIEALVRWVEYRRAPRYLVAKARGAGNPGGVNTELPADWSADRSRLLCSYPKIAVYKGKGDPEAASSFRCRKRN